MLLASSHLLDCGNKKTLICVFVEGIDQQCILSFEFGELVVRKPKASLAKAKCTYFFPKPSSEMKKI